MAKPQVRHSRTLRQLHKAASRWGTWRLEFPWLRKGPHGLLCRICKQAGVDNIFGRGHGALDPIISKLSRAESASMSWLPKVEGVSTKSSGSCLSSMHLPGYTVLACSGGNVFLCVSFPLYLVTSFMSQLCQWSQASKVDGGDMAFKQGDQHDQFGILQLVSLTVTVPSFGEQPRP